MSEQTDEPTQEQPPTPPEGEQAPPSVEPIAPPEPDTPAPEPVGRTPEAERGDPPSDESQGVGVAPTQPGDPSDEHTDEGQGDTAFRASSEDEDAA